MIISLIATLSFSSIGFTFIQPADANPPSPYPTVCGENEGQTRNYYIAANEVQWDYAPLGVNEMMGTPFGPDENVFVQNSSDRIGSKYIKALYQQYENDNFSEVKPPQDEWEHLGTLGPVIHAEVCDTIVVVFKNNSPTYDYSMHPHGVFYDKDSEGAPYNDGTSGADKDDDMVPPGQTHIYTWPVPPRAGPAHNDPSSIIWMYHSHVDEPKDTNSGLVGPIIITAKGFAEGDGTPMDVDREIVTLFTVSDENNTNYLCDNLVQFTSETCANQVLVEDEDFAESNLMHGINGYVYGNQPGLYMEHEQNVRWYLIGMGTEVDIHTPHWHGNTVVWNGNRVDVMELMPATLKTVDFVPDNVGTWMFHCHVNDHISAGMMSPFIVT
jgi:FtsP/CotA-like multicopper oxidase with cupredoxin domain